MAFKRDPINRDSIKRDSIMAEDQQNQQQTDQQTQLDWAISNQIKFYRVVTGGV